jgi:hypothetical protein
MRQLFKTKKSVVFQLPCVQVICGFLRYVHCKKLGFYRALDAPAVELLPQLPGDWLEMHEVAEPGPRSNQVLHLAFTRIITKKKIKESVTRSVADPWHGLMDTARATDPAIFDTDLHDAKKKLFFEVFLLITFWRYLYIKSHEEVTKLFLADDRRIRIRTSD